MGSFEAHTSNGSIKVNGLVGMADLAASNGSIEFDGELTPSGRSDMTTSNGSVNVSLQGIPSLQLDASTSQGTVTSSLTVLTTSSDDNHLVGDIGKAEAALTSRTSNGPVTVK